MRRRKFGGERYRAVCSHWSRFTGIAYLALLWVCFCYIWFPVSPYGIWDSLEWMMLAGSVVWSAIGVYFSSRDVDVSTE
jgi:hypothetical protein